MSKNQLLQNPAWDVQVSESECLGVSFDYELNPKAQEKRKKSVDYEIEFNFFIPSILPIPRRISEESFFASLHNNMKIGSAYFGKANQDLLGSFKQFVRSNSNDRLRCELGRSVEKELKVFANHISIKAKSIEKTAKFPVFERNLLELSKQITHFRDLIPQFEKTQSEVDRSLGNLGNTVRWVNEFISNEYVTFLKSVQFYNTIASVKLREEEIYREKKIERAPADSGQKAAIISFRNQELKDLIGKAFELQIKPKKDTKGMLISLSVPFVLIVMLLALFFSQSILFTKLGMGFLLLFHIALAIYSLSERGKSMLRRVFRWCFSVRDSKSIFQTYEDGVSKSLVLTQHHESLEQFPFEELSRKKKELRKLCYQKLDIPIREETILSYCKQVILSPESLGQLHQFNLQIKDSFRFNLDFFRSIVPKISAVHESLEFSDSKKTRSNKRFYLDFLLRISKHKMNKKKENTLYQFYRIEFSNEKILGVYPLTDNKKLRFA